MKETASSVVSKGSNGVGLGVFVEVGGSFGVNVAIDREGRVRVAAGANDGIIVAVGTVVITALIGVIVDEEAAHAAKSNRPNSAAN